MSRLLEPYPDQIDALKILLPAWFPELVGSGEDDFRVGRVFPDNLFERLPFVRLGDIGGNDDGLTDRALIDVDVFHKTFRQTEQLARSIQARLLGAPHMAGGIMIDRVITAMRPHAVPWDDDRVYRFYSSFTFSARR